VKSYLENETNENAKSSLERARKMKNFDECEITRIMRDEPKIEI